MARRTPASVLRPPGLRPRLSALLAACLLAACVTPGPTTGGSVAPPRPAPSGSTATGPSGGSPTGGTSGSTSTTATRPPLGGTVSVGGGSAGAGTTPAGTGSSGSSGTAGSRPGGGGGPGGAGAPAGSGCTPGVELIGILVVASNGVYVNDRLAATGRAVCDGDRVHTDATGVGDIILAEDRESDSIHLAENTDPRLRWTAARCVSVDEFKRGTINVTSRHRCLVVRTRDVLLYHPAASRTQYAVTSANATEVKPYRGPVPVKLQPTPDADLRRMSSTQLLARQAPPTVQPKQRSLNVYRADVLVAPPRQLSVEEIRSIQALPLRTPLIRPSFTVQVPLSNQPVITKPVTRP